MAYNYPYQQPTYFNTNYVPPQQYPQMQQPSQMQTPTVPQIAPSPSITPVMDELTARNAQFPMDGSLAYFSNVANGEIYTKQLSMLDGSVIFNVYRKMQPVAPPTVDYATRAEVDKLREEILNMIGTATAPAGGEPK